MRCLGFEWALLVHDWMQRRPKNGTAHQASTRHREFLTFNGTECPFWSVDFNQISHYLPVKRPSLWNQMRLYFICNVVYASSAA